MIKNDMKTVGYKSLVITGKRLHLAALGVLVFYGAAAVFVSFMIALEKVFS